MRQLTIATQPSFEKYGSKNRREEFLATMQAFLPWARFGACACGPGWSGRFSHPEARLQVRQGVVSRHPDKSSRALGGLRAGQCVSASQAVVEGAACAGPVRSVKSQPWTGLALMIGKLMARSTVTQEAGDLWSRI